MIALSLLLIVGAASLLGLGLWQSSSGLLSGSIAASLLAAVVLVVGARRAAAARSAAAGSAEEEPVEEEPGHLEPPAEAVTMTIPVQGSQGREPASHGPTSHEPDQLDDDLDPPDEPAPQQVSAADAARVGRMLTEVLVVDGRPRYHLPGCVHLLGRESEPLPVGEAVELGFTPCSLCEPDSALLADARRV
ncbi:MAG: hypothetical protein GEV12_05125 [Micromonosporaceae bacterium]|nr:hypothetical protein [Micromonosporaceae bacterium]